MSSLTLPNAVTSTYTYDDAGRLTLLAHTNITETLASYAYDLDNVGNRTTLTETLVTVDNLPDDTFLESGGLVVMEGEHGERTNGDTHNWLHLTSVAGYTGTSYLQTSLDIDVLYQTSELTASPRADYLVNITTPETYTVWLRGYPNNASSDSAYVGVDPGGQVVAVTGFTPDEWSWANVKVDNTVATMTITSTGLYTVNLWMREDGLRIDRLLLTTDTTYVPTGEGPLESPRIGFGGLPPATTLARTIVYTYDNLYRLTDADYSSGELYEYEYDAVGNRLKQIIDGNTTDYLYDAANRLEKLNNQAVYTFDDNGNLLNSDTLTNTFDAANRLTSSVRNSGITVEPIYNGVNDRVGQVTAGVTTTFALDVAIGLPEVIYTSEGNVYLHLPGVIVAESNTGETRYLLSDGLGSIRHAVDEGGLVVAYSEFDPYGNPIQQGDEAYGYTGEWWQDEIELLHLRARWYSPSIGTFLSRDPWRGDVIRPPTLNGFSYTYGNPINLNDPTGLDTCRDFPNGECSPEDQAFAEICKNVIATERDNCILTARAMLNDQSSPASSQQLPWTTVKHLFDLANFAYNKNNPFWNCYDSSTGRAHLQEPSPNDNWYDIVRDFVCEYGPNPRLFTNRDAIAHSIMRSSFMTRARHDFFMHGKRSGTRSFGNPIAFFEAEMDHSRNLDHAGAGRILGTYSYQITRKGSDVFYMLWNNMSRESGSRIPIRAKFSLEELLQNGSLDPQTPLFNIPRVKSILQSKERYQTVDPEGGGNLYMAIMWHEFIPVCPGSIGFNSPSTFSAPVPTPAVQN